MESPAPALPPRDVASLDGSPPVTPADVRAAATAPDARQRLGGVRAGSLHALEAYRFLSEKLQKKGSLSPEEQVKLERSKQALQEKLGEGRQGTMESRAAGGMERPVDAEGIGQGDSSVASARPRDAVPPSDEDVHTAATAPDARQRLGSVRAGSLHALEAYRFLSEKLQKKGSLSPEEQVKLGRAKGSLREAMEGEAHQWSRATGSGRSTGNSSHSASRAEFSTGLPGGQNDFEAADSPGNVLGRTYQAVPERDLPDWARRGLASAERAAGGRGKVQAVQLAIENPPGKASALRFKEGLASLFGKRVLFVKGTKEALPFDGMVDPDHPNTIIIDADSPQGMSYLLGHEMGHSIQHQRPDLYDAFQKALLDLAEDWSDYRERLKAMGYKTGSQLDAEFTNDFIGSQMANPVFWKRLQQRNEGVFKRLAVAGLDFLQTIGERIGLLHRDVRPYFKDIEAARGLLVKMLDEYQDGPMPEKSVRARELPDVGSDLELSKTRSGTTRKNPADWRKTRNLWDQLGYGELLSPANRKQIADGYTPVVDETWVKFHPEDAGLLGEIIPMHHVLGLPLTVPYPKTRHLDSHMPGGYAKNPGGVGSQLPIHPRRPPSSNK